LDRDVYSCIFNFRVLIKRMKKLNNKNLQKNNW
jgi:hypothetical protein